MRALLAIAERIVALLRARRDQRLLRRIARGANDLMNADYARRKDGNQ